MSEKNITKIFDNTSIRTTWDSEKEKYYFSVVDVISALTNSNTPRKYWNDLKRKLIDEGSQLSENIGQLKMLAIDGKKG
jgi:maltooligosyltrehalose synthase